MTKKRWDVIFLEESTRQLSACLAHMEEKDQKALQNNSGGKLKKCTQIEFSGNIPYYTILTNNMVVDKIVKFSTTTVLKGVVSFFFHVYCLAALLSVYLRLQSRPLSAEGGRKEVFGRRFSYLSLSLSSF